MNEFEVVTGSESCPCAEPCFYRAFTEGCPLREQLNPSHYMFNGHNQLLLRFFCPDPVDFIKQVRSVCSAECGVSNGGAKEYPSNFSVKMPPVQMTCKGNFNYNYTRKCPLYLRVHKKGLFECHCSDPKKPRFTLTRPVPLAVALAEIRAMQQVCKKCQETGR